MIDRDLLEPERGWATPSRVRLPPPPSAEQGIFFRLMSLSSRAFGRAELPRVFSLIHRNPRLFWGWLCFASRLMPWGRLPAPVREKIILRVAWNCRSRYEWAQHLEIALRIGVRDDEIVATTLFEDSIEVEHDRLLMRACDQLRQCKLIDETTWEALSRSYSDKEMIELVMLTGHYEMIAGVLINSGIEVEPAIEDVIQAFFRRLS
ncbi:carboxymuconolactone decarboxylase family protein [Alloalcanivorax xenomutans]|uniref:carboxymuconolactone decarboxylase family protein n=2 Tax=Alloalcanivorax xenomutans TaxID=1094342 RepID=UPI00292EA8C6|nr:carboxymuconolactone decarboxylase family protein [Alloalcanivorax xenomutans]WOA32404.1 carboxymuconolactone decarboxylase family protein [Alloalcanivorax xenomutans]